MFPQKSKILKIILTNIYTILFVKQMIRDWNEYSTCYIKWLNDNLNIFSNWEFI